MGTDCADISQCSSGQHCDEFLAVPAVPPALPSLPSPSPLLPPPAGGLSVLLCSHCQGRSRLMSLVGSLTHTVLSLVGIIVLKNQPNVPKALLAFCWFFMVKGFQAGKGSIIGAGVSNIIIPPIIDSFSGCPPITVSLCISRTSAGLHSGPGKKCSETTPLFPPHLKTARPGWPLH